MSIDWQESKRYCKIVIRTLPELDFGMMPQGWHQNHCRRHRPRYRRALLCDNAGYDAQEFLLWKPCRKRVSRKQRHVAPEASGQGRATRFQHNIVLLWRTRAYILHRTCMITMYTMAAYTGRPNHNIVVHGISPRFLPVRKQRTVKKVSYCLKRNKQIYKLL